MPDEIIPEEGDGPQNQLRKSQKIALKQQHSVVMQEPQSPIIHMTPAKKQFQRATSLMSESAHKFGYGGGTVTGGASQMSRQSLSKQTNTMPTIDEFVTQISGMSNVMSS